MAIGTSYSYSDTTTQIRTVVSDLDLLTPQEVPLLKLIGGGSETAPTLNSLDADCTMTKYEWIEDSDPAHTSLTAASVADGVTTSVLITAGDVPSVQVGTLLQIENEQMLVTANNGTTTLTVVRGWGGTTAAAHTTVGTLVRFIGSTHQEGTDAPSPIFNYPVLPYNYVQEFTRTFTVSEINQGIARYGIDNAVEREALQKTRQIFIDMEKQLFWGTRVLGTSSLPATFGGMPTFIPAANIIAGAGGDLTTAMLMNAVQKVYDAVGMSGIPDTIVCSAKARRKISQLFATYNTTTFRDLSSRDGGPKVDTVTTDFGDIDVLMGNWCPDSRVFLIRKEKLGIGPLRNNELKREMLAKTGTADKFMVSGSYTFQMRGSSYHAMVDNIVPNP